MNIPVRLIRIIVAMSMLFATLVSSAVAENQPRRHILLLNSYHPGFSWSDEEEAGAPEQVRDKLPSSDISIEYGVHENRFGEGIVGGYLLSGREQGLRAPRIGLRILAGENPGAIPIEEVPMFDDAQMARFDTPLARLPEGSIVINKPASVFTTHRQFAVTITTILIVLLITVSLLAFFIVRLLQARAALRRKTQELDRIFTLSLDLICIASLDGRFIRLNPAWESTLGYSPKELEGKAVLDLVHPDDMKASQKTLSDLMAGKSIVDFANRNRCKDGTYRWLEWRSKPYQDALIYTVGRDVTERRQTEEALRFTQYAIDKTTDHALWTTADGRIFYVNDAACRSLGYSREELLTLSIPDLAPPSSPETFAEHWRNLRKNGSVTFETIGRSKDGRMFPVEVRANFVVFDGREYNCAFVTDITERKRMEQSLRESEGFQRALLQTIPDLVWLKNQDGVFLACNAIFERLYGAKEQDIIGKTDYDFVPKDLADFFREQDHKAMAAGKPTINEEWVTFSDNGHRALLETIKTPMTDDRGELIGVLGIARDITERKKAEKEKTELRSQLQQAQKMESIGRLAGGVAHDFNNMLGVILGYGELALGEANASPQLNDALREIMKAARRSTDITRQLLAFARKQTISPKVLDINKTVAGMTGMLRRFIGEDIDLAWSPAETVWPVMIDPGQLDQIMVNLCVNARDAIVDVGKITIETGNVEFDEAYCTRHFDFVPGEYVLLAVSDNGDGMDAETLDNIFEPFFTTKTSGKGTGLGLATVYGIVKQNKGFINVYSEPGQGTAFKIYLPRHRTEAENLPEKAMEQPVAGGHETILLVEDEPAILNMTARMLENLGYQVAAARTPTEAARLARGYAGDIHLLVTDVVMPEMNGRDLAQTLRSVFPHLKCLFMSGYTGNVISHHGVLDRGVNFIQKPFSKNMLGAKVREALDEEGLSAG